MWSKVLNEKYITGFLYFKEANACLDSQETKEDAYRTEQQKLFNAFLAKRIINDYKGALNKYKIVKRYDIVHPWTIAYLSFLYFCKILDKKEYITVMEKYITLALQREETNG